MYPAQPDSADFPGYARVLSADWRRDIRAVAQRQPGWCIGQRDAALLHNPVYQRTRTRGVVLLYGAPALLALPCAVELLRALDDAAFALALRRRDRTARDELTLIGRLHAGLIRLGELNSQSGAPLDASALASQAAAARRAKSISYFVTWLPGAAEGSMRESGRAVGG